MLLQRKENWLTQPVGDELMMMSPVTGTYVSLNPVAARIWDFIESPADLDTICTRLVEEFDITSEACRAEVDAFVGQMVGNGLVSFVDN